MADPRYPSSNSSNRPPGHASNQPRRRAPGQQGHNMPQLSQPPPGQSPSVQEGFMHPTSPTSYRGPPSQFHASSSPSGFDQRTGFQGQYTMPPPPSGGMPTSPQYTYGGFHPGSHPTPEVSMMQQGVHVGYQPMMQAHGPVYQYQRHSPEGAAAGYTLASPSQLYHTPANPQVGPHTPSHPVGAQQTSAPTGHFGGQTSQFHSLPPSPAGAAYQYSQQPFSNPSPVYQTPYPSTSYQQHFSPGTEQEQPQGYWGWYPAPPSQQVHAPPRQFEGVQPQFQGPYYVSGYTPVDASNLVARESSGSSSSSAMSSTAHRETPDHDPVPSLANQVASIVLESPPESDHPSPAPPAERPDPLRAKAVSDRPIFRRPYHPNPPVHRSEWVMWVGNVPPDATEEELLQFFATPDPGEVGEEAASVPDRKATGVGSIFLISRSKCAFVNYEGEAFLDAAIKRFNGVALRDDPRCPRLVCRMRRKDDDLKAGVGGQRGQGIHTRYVKESKGKDREVLTDGDTAEHTQSSSSDDASGPTTRHRESGSSGSYASTNSSLLVRYFPQRYFILKSLTQDDLDTSCEKGLWATQKHNEGILDQAYRTSKDVFLIFSVNKSGEFYGYAKMASAIRHGEHRVSWASRASDSPASSRSSASASRFLQQDTIPEEPASPSERASKTATKNVFFSPVEGRMVDDSPMAASTGDPKPSLGQAIAFGEDVATPMMPAEQAHASAPADLGPPRRQMSRSDTPEPQHSLDYTYLRPVPPAVISAANEKPLEEFELDESGPIRALRKNKGESGSDQSRQSSLPPVLEERESPDNSLPVSEATTKGTSHAAIQTDVTATSQELVVPESVALELSTPDSASHDPPPGFPWKPSQSRDEGWGDSFKVEWIKTTRVPFTRTRHLRNPWNHDREVKVSRDGTEVEPTIGQRLIDDWDELCDPPPQAEGLHPPTKTASAPAPSTPRRVPHISSSTSPSGIPPSVANRSGKAGVSDGVLENPPFLS